MPLSNIGEFFERSWLRKIFPPFPESQLEVIRIFTRDGIHVLDHRIDRIAIVLGVPQPFERERYRGVSRDMAIFRQAGASGLLMAGLGAEVHGSDQRGVNFAASQRGAGGFQRDDAGKLLGAECQARPLKIVLNV